MQDRAREARDVRTLLQWSQIEGPLGFTESSAFPGELGTPNIGGARDLAKQGDLRPVLQLYSSVLGTSGEYENLLVGFALFVFAVKTGTHCLLAVRRFYGSEKS